MWEVLFDFIVNVTGFFVWVIAYLKLIVLHKQSDI